MSQRLRRRLEDNIKTTIEVKEGKVVPMLN